LLAEEVDVRNHLFKSGQKRVLGRSGGEGKFQKDFRLFLPAGYNTIFFGVITPGRANAPDKGLSEGSDPILL
jgi:hypothetical protein